MKPLYLVALLFFASISASGQVREQESTFDGHTELYFKHPRFVYESEKTFAGYSMLLSLFWRSDMEPGKLVLEAFTLGTSSVRTDLSLHFNIDGQVVSFSSFDEETTFSYLVDLPMSSKRFHIDRAFLDRIMSAKDVRVRLDLDRGYVEGVFHEDRVSSAKRAFREFIARMDEVLAAT